MDEVLGKGAPQRAHHDRQGRGDNGDAIELPSVGIYSSSNAKKDKRENSLRPDGERKLDSSDQAPSGVLEGGEVSHGPGPLHEPDPLRLGNGGVYAKQRTGEGGVAEEGKKKIECDRPRGGIWLVVVVREQSHGGG